MNPTTAVDGFPVIMWKRLFTRLLFSFIFLKIPENRNTQTGSSATGASVENVRPTNGNNNGSYNPPAPPIPSPQIKNKPTLEVGEEHNIIFMQIVPVLKTFLV